jgi:hypothetical protein
MLGSQPRISSRCLVRTAALSGSPGVKFFLKPERIWCLDAVSKTLMKAATPEEQRVGSGRLANRDSDSARNWSPAARPKFVKDLVVLVGGKSFSKLTEMGR